MHGSLYDRIADEISGGEIDKGLWTEAYAITNGDERLTRSQYIKLRLKRLRSPGFRGQGAGEGRSSGMGKHPASVAGTVGGWLDAVLIDLWTAWIWGWTFVFASLDGRRGVEPDREIFPAPVRRRPDRLAILHGGVRVHDVFPFPAWGASAPRPPPTMVFHTVEILALGAAVWLVARAADPSALGRLPRVLIPELVYLVVRFFHSADPVANLLSVAMFFLPVYGVTAFVRQKMI